MGKILKSLLFSLIIILWLFNFQDNIVNANNETSFIVTAYYSPLPNQKKYVTWSYLWDKRLNWEWHTTASGKKVYTWILAAPKKYPFWTKIYFEGFWVWAVEDRWWAIVKAWINWHEHDRIDIWMWYGDEWLQRALKWWKRTIKWRVVSRKQEVNLKFAKNILEGLENIKVNPETHKQEEVKKLQENFKKLKLYSWKIDWKYESIKKDLINYQLKERIIRSTNDEAAGWFWPKTYVALLRRFWSKDILIRQEGFEITETNPNVQIILWFPEIKLNWDKPEREEVKKVQELFKKLWMYSWNIDWDFNKIKRILLDFQKKAWIIKHDNSWWAGYFWEKTKAALITYFENIQIPKKKKITIDDISYKALAKISKKLQKSPKKQQIINKLQNNLPKIKKLEHRKKVAYLILSLKKA